MKKLKFLVSLHTKDNDFQMAQASAAEEAAHKFGVDAEITFATTMQWIKAHRF